MRVRHELDTVLISFRAQKLRDRLLQENPRLEQILRDAHKPEELDAPMREWVMEWMNNSPHALKFYQSDHINRVLFEALSWRDYAAVRLLDYLDHAGSRYDDPNFPNEDVVTNPFQTLWLAVHHGTGGANPDFFEDMLNLFRQWRGDLVRALPDQAEVESWMGRHPSGLDARVMEMREANRDHIIEILIDELSAGRIKSQR